MSEPTPLRLAVCLFPDAFALDFSGPVDLFGFISPKSLAKNPLRRSPYTIEAVYLSISKEPVLVSAGYEILPMKAYEETTEHYDILLIPGGGGTRADVCPQSLVDFIRRQAPRAKYILSVCTGSEVLARAGVLDGKRATTNKASFRRIQEETTNRDITWVAKARWVVDGNVWTSSGVTAGTDMAHAFLEGLVGHKIAEEIRGIVELGIRKQGDDEFAEFHGLV